MPNIAARAHAEWLPGMVKAALEDSGLAPAAITAVAATTGPGLIGGLLVGSCFARGWAIAQGKPFYAVNHLQGHALSVRLEQDVPFPYLLLLVSGGHSQLLVVESCQQMHLLGTTRDDAAGEAFDKVARMLGLPFPGGVALEKAARDGDADAVPLPLPLQGKPGCDFSFSGLKNAVRVWLEANPATTPQAVANMAAAFQRMAARHLAVQTGRAVEAARIRWPALGTLAVAGGVASNHTVREALQAVCARHSLRWIAPSPLLCTDNAAMIAWAALERRETGDKGDALDVLCRARWPLAQSL
jgi:N6-L-threonylcarbamoyladenine synthase